MLVETQVEAIRGGGGHGTSYLWSDAGELLAVASQTCAISDFN